MEPCRYCGDGAEYECTRCRAHVCFICSCGLKVCCKNSGKEYFLDLFRGIGHGCT
jgi:hypothetical protein